MEVSGPKILIIRVPTKELYEEVVKKAIKEGCSWRDGNGNNKDKKINQRYWDYWNYVGKNTVIYIRKKVLTYGSFERKRDNNSYIILTAQEYLQRK